MQAELLQEDIDKAIYERNTRQPSDYDVNTYCPIAQALKRIYNESQVHVGFLTAHLGPNREQGVAMSPNIIEVTRLQKSQWEKVKPVTFLIIKE